MVKRVKMPGICTRILQRQNERSTRTKLNIVALILLNQKKNGFL